MYVRVHVLSHLPLHACNLKSVQFSVTVNKANPNLFDGKV